MDYLEIEAYVLLLKVIFLMCLILAISLVCFYSHVKNKDIACICIYIAAVYFHQYIICFPLMYISYSILVFSGTVYLFYGIYRHRKFKESSHTILKTIVFVLCLFLPSFGGIKSYYLHKPVYLLNTHYVLATDSEIPILSYFTAPLIKVGNQCAYYRIETGYNSMTIIGVSFSDNKTPEFSDISRYKMIDNNTMYFVVNDD